jgi:hypothetical protein
MCDPEVSADVFASLAVGNATTYFSDLIVGEFSRISPFDVAISVIVLDGSQEQVLGVDAVSDVT